jgi:hypothetical protein
MVWVLLQRDVPEVPARPGGIGKSVRHPVPAPGAQSCHRSLDVLVTLAPTVLAQRVGLQIKPKQVGAQMIRPAEEIHGGFLVAVFQFVDGRAARAMRRISQLVHLAGRVRV